MKCWNDIAALNVIARVPFFTRRSLVKVNTKTDHDAPKVSKSVMQATHSEFLSFYLPVRSV